MREPLSWRLHHRRCRGITPACAGTTCGAAGRGRSGGDHPRVCGNHFLQCKRFGFQAGSPPRVREPRAAISGGEFLAGITPACAGTTLQFSENCVKRWDHPRVCGNHRFNKSSANSCRGSPPRVREPLFRLSMPYLLMGITPACAGTTLLALFNLIVMRDHPRVCGNHATAATTTNVVEGSPPRVREPQATSA